MNYIIFTKSGMPFQSLAVPSDVGKEIISWMERGEIHFLDFNIPWEDGNGFDRYVIPVDQIAGITVNVRTHVEHHGTEANDPHHTPTDIAG